ncbi:hypothetical protein RhiJN_10104 [Ceratobasidium sp. AG-Ba]|nr:hypothetical protein RhiJN_10104 [Ceratobasidium sp. AG-Ba]QRW10865.1 hypothetical protein RhiLY_09864 [Ceratobasidium sp. AG-Ba]
MSKRRAAPGGYEESSDGSELESPLASNPPTKKHKPPPYAPPRLTTALQSGTSSFRLPPSTSSLSRNSVPPGAADPMRPPSLGSEASATTIKPTQSNVEANAPTAEGAVHQPNPRINGPSQTSIDVDIPRVDAASASGPSMASAATNPVPNRTTISHERLMSELKDSLDSYRAANDAQHKKTQAEVNRLFEWIDQRIEYHSASTSQAHTQTQAPTPSVENSVAKPVLFNPPVTPEIAAIATKVVSEARSRVGKKKNGPEDNSLKEHARTRFYRMIGINAAKSIPPHYKDEYGEPDTLPLLFTDPETGYCTPKVHWKAVLTKQLAWVPTYLLWFRSTIPNDKSEVSTVLRSLTDEQIIILLHDGPLRTCQTMFRDKKKSEEELVEMRVQSLEYHRRDKASSLILQSHNTRSHCSDWEFLYHPGFMSQDESDGEGGVVTKRPEYRAQWVTNLYEAIRVAQMNKARTQPGISPCPSRRRIEIVKRPISQLERGTGSSRVPVRIALCAISRSWRNVHAAELLKSQHLVNSKANAKPNIDSFLAQHPMPDDGEDADDEGDGIDTGRREFFQPVDAFVDRHDMAQGMNEACGAVGPSDDNKSHDGGLNIASASASEADNLEESIGIHEGGTGFNLAARYQGNAIDPELQQSIHANYAKPGGNSHGSPSELAATGSITWAAQELLDTPQNCSQMPPPPFPPSHNLIGASDSSVTSNLNTAKPKRRGRPPGSKNKPKPQAGSLLDHQL